MLTNQRSRLEGTSRSRRSMGSRKGTMAPSEQVSVIHLRGSKSTYRINLRLVRKLQVGDLVDNDVNILRGLHVSNRRSHGEKTGASEGHKTARFPSINTTLPGSMPMKRRYHAIGP